jgi:hypothetical protein
MDGTKYIKSIENLMFKDTGRGSISRITKVYNKKK